MDDDTVDQVPEDSGSDDQGQPAADPPVPAPTLSGPPIVADSNVALSVSKGPATSNQVTATVPSVIGLAQADALAALQKAGFAVEILSNPNKAFKNGTVSHQLPVANGAASTGSKVAIFVSSGPAAEAVAMSVLPDVVGKNKDDARTLLSRAQLKPSILEDFSATVPAGIVMAQEPNAKDLAREPEKKGGMAWLWIVLLVLVLAVGAWWMIAGGDAVEVTVPNLVGMTEAEATVALEEVALTLGRVSEEATTAVAAGLVISQDPAGDEIANEGSRVAIVIAKAPEGVEVPDVVGMASGRAQNALEGEGLVVRIEEVFSEDVDEGDVVAQSPQAGTRVEEGTEVALSVSKGPEPPPNVTVPDVSGQTEAAAKQVLTDEGLASQSVMAYSETVPAGDVIAQAPSSGSSVAPETKVVIFVSQGPKPPDAIDVAVPDVTGMTQADAEQTLEDDGFVVEVVEVASDVVEAGEVYSQYPSAGTEAPEGSTVAILVSTGPVTP